MTKEIKHTPAPWHVGDTNKNFDAIVYGADSLCIANCTKVRGRSIEEEDANAQLIAAAPELLEALKSLVNAHDTTCRSESIAITQARKAINKAEGK